MGVILQHAIDVTSSSKAKKIAEESIKGGADWLEAGTTLIKIEGLKVVSELKKCFSMTPIVADMKTLDMGELEVSSAVKHGANLVMISGAAPDDTILEAMRTGKSLNAKIMVSLLGVRNPLERAMELEKQGIDYLVLHAAVDEKIRPDFPKLVSALFSLVKIPIAVGGGISEDNVRSLVLAGARVIIVGRGITLSGNPYLATLKIKKAISEAESQLSQNTSRY